MCSSDLTLSPSTSRVSRGRPVHALRLRCLRADGPCALAPELRPVSAGHTVACYHPGVEEAVA